MSASNTGNEWRDMRSAPLGLTMGPLIELKHSGGICVAAYDMRSMSFIDYSNGDVEAPAFDIERRIDREDCIGWREWSPPAALNVMPKPD